MSIRRATAGMALLALLVWLAIATASVLRSVPAAVDPPAPQRSSPSPQPPHAALGIRLRGGRIVEANGRDLVLRGINHGYTWFPAQAGSFAGIKAAGANSVRVSLSSGQRWPANTARDVAGVISQCKKNRLICVLDVHDTIGFGQQEGAATLAQATDYWLSIQSALTGQENYVIINIGDEPYGHNLYSTWAAETTAAIRRLRAAGFLHMLMVDAPDWGQDLSFTMRDHSRAVLAADPAGNTAFSIHMYGIFDTAPKVRNYIASYVNRGLPLVVGEFANMHKYGKPDGDAIMAYSQAYGLGYLGWSWSGNTSEVGYLDMVVNFDPLSRTPWGVRFITGPNGLSTTSREASIFSSTGRRDS